MAVSLSWGVPDIFSELPAHFFSTPNLKILAGFFAEDVLVSVARILSPPTKHDDVTA